MGMLGSSVKAWHCAAAELLGRLIINPDNEPFILPFGPQVILFSIFNPLFIKHLVLFCARINALWFTLQIYKRLVDILSFPAVDAQAAAIGALYNLAEVNMDCRLKLAGERW